MEVELVDAPLGMVCEITYTHPPLLSSVQTSTYQQLSVSQMHVVSDQVWEENASRNYILTKYAVNQFT